MTKATITIEHGAAPSSSASEAGADVPTSHRASAFDLVAATPWAIEPVMLDTIRAIALRENEPIEALEAKIGRPLQNARAASLRGDVAIVPVTGPIFRYANLMTEFCGATSLAMLAKDFTAALEDPQVSAIVLEINSPGGQVTGVAEFAAMVRAAGKPVTAYVDGTAASAAYWIAAAANEVVMSKNGMAGNVGAVLGLDARKDPNKVEMVSSQSPNKRPDVATDAGRAQLQQMLDAHAQVFINDVAEFRGMTPEAVVQDWNGGAVFIGADAVGVGMADRVATLEEVIAGLSGSTRKGASMSATNGQPAAAQPAITREFLAEHHADLVAAIREEGLVAGRAEGALAERERIQAVEAQTLVGHEALIASLKFDGKTTGPEAAVAVLNAEREVAAKRKTDIYAGAPAPLPHAAAPVAAEAAAAAAKAGAGIPATEAAAQERWDADEAIRGEFKTFGAYWGYCQLAGKSAS